MYNFPSGNFPVKRRRLLWGPSAADRTCMGSTVDRLEKLPLGKLHIWENVSHLGKYPWKLQLGKTPLRKYLTSKNMLTIDLELLKIFVETLSVVRKFKGFNLFLTKQLSWNFMTK